MDVSDAGPMPPDGHNTVPVGAPEYCELVTSATYDGDIELCLTYDDGDVSSNELRLKLMHHDGSEWVDITSSLDDEANLVCGLATSFSPFLLVEKMSCCQDRVGDANMEGGDKPTIGDVIAMVDMLFVSEVDVPCLAEADVDQSGGLDPVRGDITIGDIIFLIDYLFVTGEGLGLPDCL